MNYEQKWKELRKCLNYEVKTTRKNIKDFRRDGDYGECLKNSEIILTLNWILEEMESLEDYGRLM